VQLQEARDKFSEIAESHAKALQITYLINFVSNCKIYNLLLN